MNLTHNIVQRDYLVPVNPNINQQGEPTARQGSKSKEKELGSPEPKFNPEIKIQALQYTVENLRAESEAMNAMIRTKNQEIANLKSQLKSQGLTVGLETKPIRQIYYLNNLTSMKQEAVYKVSAELDQAIYQIKVLRKQRDDLQKYVQQLQQQAKTQSPSPQPLNPISQHQQQQHSRVVEQYEQHIASLASKLSTVHKLESEVAHLTQERALILTDFQGMRGELVNRVGYCEHLENELRRLEGELQKRGPAGGVALAEVQAIKGRNQFLESEVAKLAKQVVERDEKIAEIQIGKSGYVQVTKEAFQSMQTNIASLQEKLNSSTEGQKKEAEKTASFQAEINKLTRELAEKTKKAETQTEKVGKLESQKFELSSSLKNAKNQLKQMEKKYEDKSYEAEQYKTESEKNKKLALLSQDFLPELQNYKKKVKQSEELTKKLTDQLSKIENEYRLMTSQNQKARQLAEQSRAKWDTYDKTIKRQNDTIMKLHEVCSKRIEEIDKNIEKNLNLQGKLREYARQNDSLTDEIQQYIKENQYAKGTELNLDL